MTMNALLVTDAVFDVASITKDNKGPSTNLDDSHRKHPHIYASLRGILRPFQL